MTNSSEKMASETRFRLSPVDLMDANEKSWKLRSTRWKSMENPVKLGKNQ